MGSRRWRPWSRSPRPRPPTRRHRCRGAARRPAALDRAAGRDTGLRGPRRLRPPGRACPTASPSGHRGSSATSPRSTPGGGRRTRTRAPRFDLFATPVRERVRAARHLERDAAASRPAGSTPLSRRSASCSPRSTASSRRRRRISSTTTARPARRRLPAPSAGRAARRTSGLPGLAAVFLDSCGAEATTRSARSWRCTSWSTSSAPSRSARRTSAGAATSATSPEDLMAASLSGNELEAHVLDGGRDDYYGHPGAVARRAGLALPGATRLARPRASLAPGRPHRHGRRHAPGSSGSRGAPRPTTSGPITYRVYQDGRFVVGHDVHARRMLERRRGRHERLLGPRRRPRRPPRAARRRSGSGSVSASSTRAAGSCATRSGRRRSAGVSVRRTASGQRALLAGGPGRRRPPRLPRPARDADDLADEARARRWPATASRGRRLARGGRPRRQHRPGDHVPLPLR